MRVLVSLAVHEQPAVVRNQLQNLVRFLQDPVIVLHVSRDFDVRAEELAISDRVWINPERHFTAWGTGILALLHIQNVRYALDHVEFDYVAFHSSNDLFVRSGVEGYMEGHDVGIDAGEIGDWWWWRQCAQDRPLRRFLRRSALAAPCLSQIEGSFYRKELFQRILDHLEFLERRVSWSFLEHSSRARVEHPRLFWNPHYPREEVYFPTALAACGLRPTVLPYTYLNWKRKLELSIEEVEAIRLCEPGLLPGFKLAERRELYAVKRVARSMEDKIRRYIDGLKHE